MPHHDLDPIQSELVVARMETDNRLRLQAERFERFAAKRRERLDRERSNNQTRLNAVLSRALGTTIPKGAAIGIRADGSGVVEWPDAPRAPATVEASEAHEDEAPITLLPKPNGALAGAAT